MSREINMSGKVSKIIIFVIILAAFAAGIYFKDDAIRLYKSFNKGVQDFQQTDFGQTLSQIGKEVLTPPPLKVAGSDKQAVLLKSKIITETNLQRETNGNLPALGENEKLDEAAAAKANDMFKNQYFEHVSPSGVDPGRLVQSYGYDYIVAGENLILGNFASEKDLVQAWMDSPGHRANILNNRYSEIGVAVIKGTYKGESVWIGVQEFGLPLSECSEPNASLKSEISSEKTQLDNLSTQIEAKRSQISSANARSAVYSQMVDDYNQLVVQYNSLAEQLKESIATYNAQVKTFNDCVSGTK